VPVLCGRAAVWVVGFVLCFLLICIVVVPVPFVCCSVKLPLSPPTAFCLFLPILLRTPAGGGAAAWCFCCRPQPNHNNPVSLVPGSSCAQCPSCPASLLPTITHTRCPSCPASSLPSTARARCPWCLASLVPSIACTRCPSCPASLALDVTCARCTMSLVPGVSCACAVVASGPARATPRVCPPAALPLRVTTRDPPWTTPTHHH